MSTVVLIAMLCTTPLTGNAAKDAVTIDTNCAMVEKAYTADHKQCDVVRKAFAATTGKLSMPAYLMCGVQGVDNDPDFTILPLPYKAKGLGS